MQKRVRVDRTLLLLNVLHLMLIAFLPFPTSVLAEAFHRGMDESIAAAFYGGILTVIGIFVNAMWRYAASPLTQKQEFKKCRSVHLETKAD
jgi:uncharacterized membrane protein